MNYIAIFVSALIGIIVGMTWYSPKLFGKAWMKATGVKDEKPEPKDMAVKTLLAYLSTLAMAYVLSMLIGLTGATTFIGGATTAFWAWLGFMVPVTLSPVLWENKDKSLFFINGAQWLVSAALIGGVLAVWV